MSLEARTEVPAHQADATTLMDRIYRPQRFIYDLTRKYYLFGRDRLIADLAADDGRVLEIGCGTGRNLALMAARYPDASLFGVDVSTAMLQVAEATLTRRHLSNRVRTTLADATKLELDTCFGGNPYDRIVFSYTLSMIPDWSQALERAVGLLAPGGRLMLVDFGQLGRYPGWMRAGLFAWLRGFHVHPIAELHQALILLADRRGLSLDWQPLYGGYAVSAVLTNGVKSPRVSR